MNPTTRPTRRTLVKGVAWSVPVVSIAATAPAFAASTSKIVKYVEAIKCPGAASPLNKTYVFVFEFDTMPTTFTASSVMVNNVIFEIRTTYVELVNGKYLGYVITESSDDSANAAGSGIIRYTAESGEVRFDFIYTGTHPDPNFCRSIGREK